MGAARTLKVTQVRSGIGFSRNQKRVLRALGLGKMHRTVELPDNAAVRGMLRTVPHLIRVEDTGGRRGGEA